LDGREPSAKKVFSEQREMANPGPAFEILYAQLWKLSAALISCVLGQQATTQEGRLRTLLLISSLAAFDTGSHVAVRILGWPDLRDGRLEPVKKAIHDQIDLIATPMCK
jgi:TetR/AcrR family transcriptional regulator, regulator of cefoperazone and chloramphenicol sensitivity